jgi:hypothetical protein
MTAADATRPHSLTTSLGIASVALGLSELAAPRRVALAAGVAPTTRSRRVVQLLGLREIGHGAAVLAGSPRLVWTRVAGDAIDVALLGKALMAAGANRRRGGISIAILTVIGAADVWAAKQELSKAR